MILTSPAFHETKPIPSRYANYGVPGGANISPPLRWSCSPAGTKSFALSMIDHNPSPHQWSHWLLVNIPSVVEELPTGASPAKLPICSMELFNSFGEKGYSGPQPPQTSGVHRYVFTLYALYIETTPISPYASFDTFQKIIHNNLIATTSLTGIYER
jgi:Raf kinase inhibitor-like YbhB/YbcL family protein